MTPAGPLAFRQPTGCRQNIFLRTAADNNISLLQPVGRLWRRTG